MRTLLTLFYLALLLTISKIEAQDWKLLDQLGSSDQQPADNLGVSVDISDSLLIAGAWWAEGNSGINSSGAAYIYRMKPDGTFKEVAKLSSPYPEALGYFGFRVAISGSSAMVGAFNEDHSGLGNAGRVYAYHLDDLGEWELTDTLKITSTENADYFGYDISMIDNYALIGAYRHSSDHNNENFIAQAGAAFIYKKENTKWSLIKKIVAPDRASKDYFGRHVSMDESGIVISAFNKNSTNSDLEAGAAYALKCDAPCAFEDLAGSETVYFQSSDPNFGQQFGWDVGISGKWIAVGKRSDSDQPDGGIAGNTGSVYFFKWENGSWVEKQKVYADDFAGQAHFGERIAIDGSICVIGAGGEARDENGEDLKVRAGAAYVFELNEEEVWVQKQKLAGTSRNFGDLYANEGLAIDKNRFVAGAWLADTINSVELIDGGAVYVYEREGDLPSGVENIDIQDKILLANNPSEGPIFLISKEAFKGEMQVYSLNGTSVHHLKLTINQRKAVDLSHLDQGLYWIKIFNQHGSQVFKWVKQ